MVFSKTALVGRDEQLGRVCVLRSLQEVRSLDPEECNDSSILYCIHNRFSRLCCIRELFAESLQFLDVKGEVKSGGIK